MQTVRASSESRLAAGFWSRGEGDAGQIRIISARLATSHERRRYEEGKEA
jgi:uncharacterized DUF497 family protein